jgi:phosphatidylserine/phosphatidylglycerophosphate/cardiolipin synthase-like enzyme
MPPRLTEYELETAAAQPAGACELVANRDHFTRIVQDGIAKATVSLDILTADFKSMLVPLTSAGRKSNHARSIIHLFRSLAQKGVEIRILHAGTPSGPALLELKKISADENARLTIRRCPRLHAKAVIIDARTMYLGSANLTGAGLGAKGADKRNFELGIFTHAPALIESVLEHFNSLWEGHPCKKCRRKDVCPVPLEEPDL